MSVVRTRKRECNFWGNKVGNVQSGKIWHCSYGHLAGTIQKVRKIHEYMNGRNIISGVYCIGLMLISESNCKVYPYIVKHNYVLGGVLFTIYRAQLHVLATNFGHHQVVQWKLISRYTCIYRGCIRCRVGSVSTRSRKYWGCGGLGFVLVRNRVWTENYACL